MTDFERKFHMLVLALGLGDAGNFRVVGEEGKKNYQLLFSTLIKMIENDENEFFIDKERKPEIISSLKRTIDFYNTNSPKELQQLIESMKKDDPTNFMIIPAYVNLKRFDHVYSLILYQQKEQCVVTMVDKLRTGSGEYSNAVFSKVKPENLTVLSDILFHTKLEYHKDSFCNLSKIIYQVGEGESGREYLNLTMNTYKGICNCPVIEMLSALKTALYNCRENIFNHTMDVALEELDEIAYIKPKIGQAKVFYEHLFNAFKEGNATHDQLFEHAWTYYLKRKTKKATRWTDPRFDEWSVINDYALKFKNDPETLEAFKKTQNTSHSFRIFSSEEKPKLETTLNNILSDWQSLRQNKLQQFSDVVQKINKEDNSVLKTEKIKSFSVHR